MPLQMLETLKTHIFVQAIIANLWVSLVLLTPYCLFKMFQPKFYLFKIIYLKLSLAIVFIHWLSCFIYNPNVLFLTLNQTTLRVIIEPRYNVFFIVCYVIIILGLVLKKILDLKQMPVFHLADQAPVFDVFNHVFSYKIDSKFLQKLILLMPKNGNNVFTFGFLKPIIVFPLAYFNHLSYKQAECIFLHELAHIFYNDFLYKIIVEFLSAILFFNPIVWILRSQLNFLVEVRADNWAIQHSQNKSYYLKSLYQFTKFNIDYQNSLNLRFLSSSSQVLKRFKIQTNHAKNNLNNTVLNFCVVLIAFVLIFSLPRFSFNLNSSSLTSDVLVKNDRKILKSEPKPYSLKTNSKHHDYARVSVSNHKNKSNKSLKSGLNTNSVQPQLMLREFEPNINLAELDAHLKIEPLLEIDNLDYTKLSDYYRNKYFNDPIKNIVHDEQNKLIEKRVHQLVLKSLVVTYAHFKESLRTLKEIYNKRTLNLEESLQLEQCIQILKKLNAITYQMFDYKIPSFKNSSDSTDL